MSIQALDAAVASERLLRHGVGQLARDQHAGHGKVLLTRRTTLPASPTTAELMRIRTAAEWTTYLGWRVEVEREFGGTPDDAHQMVERMREREATLGLRTFFVGVGDQVVGAIARFAVGEPHAGWARLQEIDVFPGYRGHGYGDAALAAMCRALATADLPNVIVGADEDDWPLSWYRRRGFVDAVRVTAATSSTP